VTTMEPLQAGYRAVRVRGESQKQYCQGGVFE
jgi:hypothetical protein